MRGEEAPVARDAGAASPDYAAPFWLPGGHVQTIVPARFLALPSVSYRRERWDTPDGDFIDLDFALPEPAAADAPVLVLFHGLEGSSGAQYSLSIMRAFADVNWRALVVHFRGCSGEPNRVARAYHSGDSAEADWILRRVAARFAGAPLHAVGISLGGNMLAKWLGEQGEAARFVRAAASIGSPLDLVASGRALSRGFNLLYTRMFLATLRSKALAKLARFPGIADRRAIEAAPTLYEFDDAFTAPLHGFAGVDDYWTRASAKPHLARVAVPLLLLNARNDPFVPEESLPRAHEVATQVELDQPLHGGHIGFPLGPFPGRIGYLPVRLRRFFASIGAR
jgi:uncharacterized protein